jgi:hypothetical protein
MGTSPSRTEENIYMSAKIMSTVIVAGFLFAVSAPVFAADAPATTAPPAVKEATPPAAKTDTTTAPKTKADCNKLTDMKWDKKTKTCVKK